MKQYKFLLDEPYKLERYAAQVADILKQHPDAVPFMQVTEPSGDSEYIKYGLGVAQQLLPGIPLFGMTSHCAQTADTHAVNVPVLTLLLFEHSNFLIQEYDCHTMTPNEAGVKFCNSIRNIPNIKGVLMFSSDMKLSPHGFIDEIATCYPDLPVFGAIAGTSTLTEDLSCCSVDDRVYDRGIIAAAFYGEDLEIEIKHTLGWKPLGREFTITGSTPDGRVQTIDNEPAINIYKKYLGVDANEYFFENTAAFPLVFHDGSKLVGRVALNYSETEMEYAMEIPEGTKASLAYAKDNYLLKDSLDCANALIDFVPEALLLYACMSRRTLMGDEQAEKEFSYYENVNKDATWSCGYAEILYNNEGAGLLNGTTISVAMREGPANEAQKQQPYDDITLHETPGMVSLNDRLIHFLESTTDDLRDNVNQLFEMASHDQLTKIFNRAAFQYWFDRKYDSLETDKHTALVMFDIDHFKRVNDTYGHDVGDDVIRGVINCIKEKLPEDAIIGRWGGEEFMCLLPGADKMTALNITEGIRKHVEETGFDPVPQVTISTGVIVMTPNMDFEKQRYFTRVDEALYEAKETGRNKVVYMEME